MVSLFLFLISCLSAPQPKNNPVLPPHNTQTPTYNWAATADSVHATMCHTFLSANGKYFVQNATNTTFHYWWNAHALDVLTDGYLRTHRDIFKELMQQLIKGIKATNGGAYPNDYYDDMEWLALATLRAHAATGDTAYLETTQLFWTDIKGGWNTTQGGGIAWRKTQTDYKNTPANAPAVILAARLYHVSKNADDLAWATKIYTWLKKKLVDPATGLAWDGINREGNGQIDRHWKFTYNQGVLIGAALELYKATNKKSYLDDAIKTADYTIRDNALAPGGILKDEGNGDGGLFKGILARYLSQLAQAPALPLAKRKAYTQFLKSNAETLYQKGIQRPAMLIDGNWSQKPASGTTVDLSTHLSGAMLLEIAAELKTKGYW